VSATALSDRLGNLASRTELEQADLARALGTSPRTVARWLHEGVLPRREARERLLEVLAVLERLAATMTPAAAHDWLFSPNPLLEYQKPIDLLRAGNYRLVLGAIDALADGVFV
jgi:putative toxin-antitoxin system antitoxin component (TIGR02293 family)